MVEMLKTILRGLLYRYDAMQNIWGGELAFLWTYRPFNWHTFCIINGRSDNVSPTKSREKLNE